MTICLLCFFCTYSNISSVSFPMFCSPSTLDSEGTALAGGHDQRDKFDWWGVGGGHTNLGWKWSGEVVEYLCFQPGQTNCTLSPKESHSLLKTHFSKPTEDNSHFNQLETLKRQTLSGYMSIWTLKKELDDWDVKLAFKCRSCADGGHLTPAVQHLCSVMLKDVFPCPFHPSAPPCYF